MDAQDQVAVAQLFLGLGLVTFGVGYMYRRTRAARCREALFTLRDDLFDYMWQNGLSYDLPAYRLMRTFLNGAIRVVGEVSPLAFLAVVFAIGRRMPEGDGLSEAIEAVEDERTREHLKEVRSNCVREMLVFLGPIGIVIRSAAKLGRIRNRLRKWVYRQLDELVMFGRQDSDVYLMRSSGVVHRR